MSRSSTRVLFTAALALITIAIVSADLLDGILNPPLIERITLSEIKNNCTTRAPPGSNTDLLMGQFIFDCSMEYDGTYWVACYPSDPKFAMDFPNTFIEPFGQQFFEPPMSNELCFFICDVDFEGVELAIIMKYRCEAK